MDFKDFAHKVKGATPFPGVILAFDPGETTGFCAMKDFEILELAQIETPINDVPLCYRNVDRVVAPYFTAWGDRNPTVGNPSMEVACEDYRIYDWKSDDHKWSGVHTIKVVGFVQAVCGNLGLPPTMRMAQTAKGFVTDDKLRMWNLYAPTAGQKHARDALRHAAYHALFHKRVQ